MTEAKPRRFKFGWRSAIFALLLLLGALDWANVTNPCEWPISACRDYPLRHPIRLTPGLYPPMFFADGCQPPATHSSPLIGWSCQTKLWSAAGAGQLICEASCRINPFSWVYVLLYWFLIATVLGWLLQRLSPRRSDGV
jgi:hypothetical protein